MIAPGARTRASAKSLPVLSVAQVVVLSVSATGGKPRLEREFSGRAGALAHLPRHGGKPIVH